MRIESAIKQEFSVTRHNTVMVSERKLVKRLVLRQFQDVIPAWFGRQVFFGAYFGLK